MQPHRTVVTLVDGHIFLYSNNLKEQIGFYDVKWHQETFAAHGKEFISTFINKNAFLLYKTGGIQ
jgi:hypothetical protein